MAVVILFLSLGALLFFIETFAPGGVCGFAGAVLCICAVWISGVEYGILGAVVSSAVSIFLAFSAFAVWLWVVPKMSVGKKMYLNTSQDGRVPCVDNASMIGRTGVALTIMVPTGKVEIGGASYDARCESLHIEKGDSIKVVGADSFVLKVEKFNEKKEIYGGNDNSIHHLGDSRGSCADRRGVLHKYVVESSSCGCASKHVDFARYAVERRPLRNDSEQPYYGG